MPLSPSPKIHIFSKVATVLLSNGLFGGFVHKLSSALTEAWVLGVIVFIQGGSYQDHYQSFKEHPTSSFLYSRTPWTWLVLPIIFLRMVFYPSIEFNCWIFLALSILPSMQLVSKVNILHVRVCIVELTKIALYFMSFTCKKLYS